MVHKLRAQTDALEESTGVGIGRHRPDRRQIDVSDKLGDALPLYLAIVVGLSLILLLLVFRSIVVPLLATGGFLLSLAAAFGAVVAVYQWGWLGNRVRRRKPGRRAELPADHPDRRAVRPGHGLPGVHRLRHARVLRARRIGPEHAVRTGFSHAAPVVTAAAIIMVSVFAGFIFSHLTMVRPLGFAMAFGVLLDAFVVRMTMIPAVMYLLGERPLVDAPLAGPDPAGRGCGRRQAGSAGGRARAGPGSGGRSPLGKRGPEASSDGRHHPSGKVPAAGDPERFVEQFFEFGR